MATLRLILGDQLNHQHSWYQERDEEVVYVFMEVLSETGYVRHHVQKVVGFFLAMRAFAGHLRDQGHRVHYWYLDDPENQQRVTANCAVLVERYGVTRFQYQEPDEWRLDQELREWCAGLSIASERVSSEHFLTGRTALGDLFVGKKGYLMETFYREMRRRHQILMEPDGETPLTGRWNYDAENRKKMPKSVVLPPVPRFFREVREVVELLDRMQVRTIGTLDPARFDWPVTRAEALKTLEHFIQYRLAAFGMYQDAMTQRDWLLFHSRLSFCLNIKLLHPKEVVDACIAHWRLHADQLDFAGLEGFVRQVVGWREYMRGVYWARMPEYAELNFFGHKAPLPSWYWTGKTGLNCLRHSIEQSLERAYAHHIQRLMVTGNFALLLGVDPDQVDEWYLGIYMDAVEWVEITNTRGMSQFADGGIVGTKPYVSSANYMHKMGDYCENCKYKKDLKYGSGACPFNSLYWDFYHRNRALLERNPRIGMMYKVWDKMAEKEQNALLRQAEMYKQQIESL